MREASTSAKMSFPFDYLPVGHDGGPTLISYPRSAIPPSNSFGVTSTGEGTEDSRPTPLFYPVGPEDRQWDTHSDRQWESTKDSAGCLDDCHYGRVQYSADISNINTPDKADTRSLISERGNWSNPAASFELGA